MLMVDKKHRMYYTTLTLMISVSNMPLYERDYRAAVYYFQAY